MLDLCIGLAKIAALAVAFVIGVRGFLWLVFFVSSLFPYIGKRHRHARWEELNRPRGWRHPPAPVTPVVGTDACCVATRSPRRKTLGRLS